MGSRPLRQHYLAPDGAGVRLDVDRALWPATRAWSTQRARLLEVVRGFAADDWDRPTRCDAWTAAGVIGHLVVVDGFFTLTFGNALAAAEPTRYLAGFDPSSSTDALVATAVDRPVAELLENFATGTAALAETIGRFEDAAWARRAEGPLGHLPAHQLLAHGLWDSWLHERDLTVPAGTATGPEPDEVRAAAAWMLVFAGLQGGLLHDTAPVGPGPEAPVDVSLRFDDLPGAALRIVIDTGVTLAPADPDDAVAAGPAVDFVEGITGRAPVDPVLDRLPADLAAQISRAAATL
jgi:uncharacterized protein (TIGR03083 family)